jgi:hypothetical protein
MPSHHLPAVGSPNEYDCEPEFGLILSFWYSAPGSNCCVAKKAHLDILTAKGKTVSAGAFCWYDVCFGNNSSPGSGAQKIIGNDSVQDRAVDSVLGVKPFVG